MINETFWSKFLGRVVPREVKRKLVLVAVFVELEKERGVDQPRLSDLNAQMRLVDNEDILTRFADLARLLFKSQACPVKKDASINDNCSELMRWLPSWVRYGERDKMFNDIAEITVSHISHQ